MADDSTTDAPTHSSLGNYINSIRRGLDLSLRDVEEATNKEVSNDYLSQLENGKIAKPSPHILYSLSQALNVKYETLMERAGYIVPASESEDGRKHGRAATFAIDNLTRDEEKALLEHLAYLRWQRKK
jgi:transcriptional regulator with XRE-family HTH domain